jgi:serine/threonine kinase PknH
MALFISYSSQDRSKVDALANALRRSGQQIWFDQELGGGDAWWSRILEQIRACNVFVVALSNAWLQSKPSQAEFRYAQTLNRPILPVWIGEIDSVRVNPVAALQIIDYRNPTGDAGIQLLTAVHSLQANPQRLPYPLPQEPPVPFAYIMRLNSVLTQQQLSPQQQVQLLAELNSHLAEDGDDPSARMDIARLLRMLQDRHDVTYRTRTDVENLLASIEPSKSGSHRPWAIGKAAVKAVGAASRNAAQARPGPRAVSMPGAPPPAAGAPTPARRKGRAKKRLILIGSAVLVLVVAITAAVLAMQGGSSNSSSGRLATYLLGPPDISVLVGDSKLVVDGPSDQLRTPKWSLSNPNCAGAFEPILAATYQGASGFSAVSGQTVQTDSKDPTNQVIEGVAAFSSTDAASTFVQASANKWGACALAVTETLGAKSYVWYFNSAVPTDLHGDAPKVSIRRTMSTGVRSCSHVLGAVSELVVDVLACAPNAVADAGSIFAKITAKIKQ